MKPSKRAAKKYREQHREEIRERDKEWAKNHPIQRKQWRKNYQQKVKQEIMNMYGKICSCCGESKLTFLTIEHSFKDGNKTSRRGQELYFWLRKNNFPQNLGLEVLCWNCNVGRWINGGKCPHKEDVTV